MSGSRVIRSLCILFLLLPGLVQPPKGYTQSVVSGRTILFQIGNEIWLTNEGGSPARRVFTPREQFEDIVKIDWNHDSRGFSITTIAETGNFRYLYSNDGAALGVENNIQVFYLNESPSGKYQIKTSVEYSRPLWTTGMGDYMTDRLVLRKLDGTEVVLTDRSDGVARWSIDEQSVAFYERVSSDRDDLVVYWVEDDITIRTAVELSTNPFVHVLNHRHLFFFPKINTPTLWDLEANTFKEYSNVHIGYPSHGYPLNLLKSVDGGSKVVYSNVSFGSGEPGIYILDLVTGSKEIVVDQNVFTFDVRGEILVFAQGNNLFVTTLKTKQTRKIYEGSRPVQAVAIQPRLLPPNSGRRVLVLLDGMGTAVPPEGQERAVFSNFWPIIDTALELGIYHDVIQYSYAGGKMESGVWKPVIGNNAASYQSLVVSVQTLADMLSMYSKEYPDTTFDLIGYSLGGKVVWEHIKTILGRKITYSVGRVVTLNSPINGRHRDYFFQTIGQIRNEVISSKIADDLHREAANVPTQASTEAENLKYYILVDREQILVYMLASTDDCFVPYMTTYPHKSAIVTGNGVLYAGLGRGTLSGIRFTNCVVFDDSPLDLRDLHTIAVLRGNESNSKILDQAFGHDRILWHQIPWLEIKELFLKNKTPRGVN